MGIPSTKCIKLSKVIDRKINPKGEFGNFQEVCNVVECLNDRECGPLALHTDCSIKDWCILIPCWLQKNHIKMLGIIYKTCNATFVCGFFIHYMLQETYPLLVLEALTYQVKFLFKTISHNKTILQGMMLLSLYTLSALIDELLPNMKGEKEEEKIYCKTCLS